ncbi:hypothetical protein D3C72_1374440 [compost metagenome]
MGVQLIWAPSSRSLVRSVTGATPGSVTFWSAKRKRCAMPKRTASTPVPGSIRRDVTPSVSALVSEMRSAPENAFSV